MRALGIDIGSLTTKVVILDDDRVLCSVVSPSSEEAETSAIAALDIAVAEAGLAHNADFYAVSTGIGGKSVSLSQQHKAMTTCLARGTHRLFPSARTVIDMGAESSTVVKINERGRVSDWANHDKCAAGSGVFLQQMSKLLQVTLADMSALSTGAKSRADITNTCAVFAESEVISHIHSSPPTPKDEIVAGIYYSVVSRLMTLCKRLGIEREVAAAGGVALNEGLVKVLEQELGFEVLVPDQPQSVAALGAAIIARENMEKGA